MALLRVFDSKAREVIYTHMHDLGVDVGGILTKPQSPHIREEGADIDDFQFFEVDDKRVNAVVDALTAVFPGKDIQVYTMTESAVRPAGDIVRKKVTKEGVLPF